MKMSISAKIAMKDARDILVALTAAAWGVAVSISVPLCVGLIVDVGVLGAEWDDVGAMYRAAPSVLLICGASALIVGWASSVRKRAAKATLIEEDRGMLR